MAKQIKRNAGGVMTKFRQAHEFAYPERYESPVARNLSPGQHYRLMGWHEDQPEVNHPMQGTLFPHPHGLENPPRWEDMPKHARDRVLDRVRDFGVTPESAHKAFGTQVDQQMHEEDGRHTSFYAAEGVTQSGGPAPRQVLLNTMKETKAPWHEVVAGHSITSPQTRFATRSALDQPLHPNDQGARAAIRQANAGMTGADYRAGRRAGPNPMTVLPANVAKATDVIHASRQGISPQESGLVGPSPKVRPYHNTLLDPSSPEGNYFVSDRHSGIAGMAPHLAGTDHAEAYMKIAGIHAFHDKIARDVMEERGLTGQVNRGQSAQWTQEKASKGQVKDVMDVTRAAQQPEANRNVNPAQYRQYRPGFRQGELF